MEVHTLTEIIKNQQNAIISLSVHLDSLVEELDEAGVLDSDKLDERIKNKIKQLQAIADTLKQGQEIPPMFNFGGPIGEA